MKKPGNSHWPTSLTLLLLCIGTMVESSPITRMDIFDTADNHLLFVTFAYNGSGECTGRSVFTSDSTFLRSSSFTPRSATAGGKDVYVDYNENTVFTTTIQPSADGETSFSTVDLFGQTQYGSPLKYRESDSENYDVSQDKTKLCSQEYVYNDDKELTRINVSDKNEKSAWYALVSHEDVSVRHKRIPLLNRPVQVSVNRRAMRLRFGLTTGGIVGCELFSPAGRKVLTILKKRLGAGSQTFIVKDLQISAGAYIMKMTVNGKPMVNRTVVVQD
jgi:hypothetical protein